MTGRCGVCGMEAVLIAAPGGAMVCSYCLWFPTEIVRSLRGKDWTEDEIRQMMDYLSDRVRSGELDDLDDGPM